jgi:hypothetical protein
MRISDSVAGSIAACIGREEARATISTAGGANAAAVEATPNGTSPNCHLR